MTDNPDLAEAIDILRNWKGIMPVALVDRVNAFLARHPEKPKLLPCPFCGGEANVQGTSAVCFVQCSGCQSDSTVRHSEADAIAAWNRRSGPVSGGKPE